MMAKSNNDKRHIIKREEGWAVKKEGSLRATKVYDTKNQAIREASKQAGSDLIIHKKDGSIQEWRTFKKK